MPLPERLDGIPADFFDEAHHLQQQINNKYGLIPGVSDKVELLYRPRNTQDGPLEFPLDPRILNSDLMRISEVIDEPLLPPTLDIQNLPEDFTRQYALRTAIYVRLIESIRSGEDLTAEEIEDIRLTLQTLNNIDRYDHNPNRSLYDDQMDMFHAIRETLEQGEREMYVKIPTGVGKTAIFAEFVEAFTHDNERKVLIIVPWQDLVTQTANEVVRFANQQAGQVYQHSRDYSQQVTVITRDSLHAALANGDLLPEDYDLVIGDEAHRLVGEEYSQDIRQFTHAVKIGFTATPAYDEKRHVRNVFSKEAYSMTVDEAVARDLITPYENWIALTRGSGNARAQREDVTQIILDNFINQIGMVNCESIEDAEEQAQVIRELLDKYGLHHINVAAYHSNLSNNTREQLLQQWMQGTTQILCQIRTLGEGINNPRATFCINSYPRYSAVDEEQTGGRVLRKDPNNPNKVGIIVDCVDENADPRKLPYTFTEVAG